MILCSVVVWGVCSLGRWWNGGGGGKGRPTRAAQWGPVHTGKHELWYCFVVWMLHLPTTGSIVWLHGAFCFAVGSKKTADVPLPRDEVLDLWLQMNRKIVEHVALHQHRVLDDVRQRGSLQHAPRSVIRPTWDVPFKLWKAMESQDEVSFWINPVIFEANKRGTKLWEGEIIARNTSIIVRVATTPNVAEFVDNLEHRFSSTRERRVKARLECRLTLSVLQWSWSARPSRKRHESSSMWCFSECSLNSFKQSTCPKHKPKLQHRQSNQHDETLVKQKWLFRTTCFSYCHAPLAQDCQFQFHLNSRTDNTLRKWIPKLKRE